MAVPARGGAAFVDRVTIESAGAGTFTKPEKYRQMNYLAPDTITWTDFMIRISAAIILPLILGIERFVHRKPIDFRPYVIISVGACGLMIGVVEFARGLTDSQFGTDPSRVLQGVITGIGFLGAGAMFREGHFVQGAASAASIWVAGAIGLICAMGEIWLAISISAIVLAVLLISGPFTEDYDSADHEGR